ncbi:MAG: hypothetical protein LBD31_02520 [Treponema sp.]|nr:hypothetical protein [Treponema sp.]
MYSFVLWYTPGCTNCAGQGGDKKEAWVHINLWKEGSHEKGPIKIDFGIMVRGIDDIKSIHLYSPFAFQSCEDLAGLLRENPPLIRAVFNESYEFDSGEQDFIIRPKEGDPFILHALLMGQDLNVQGRIITINTETMGKPLKQYYFRFRITIPRENDRGLISTHKRDISRFSDYLTSTEIIDFRLNDIRSCDRECRNHIGRGSLFGIRSVNYFILRDPADLVIYHGGETRCRHLEPEIWEPYGLPREKRLIAYHFYQRAPKKDGNGHEHIRDFSVLVRFQRQEAKILIILALTLLLGLLGGLAAGLAANFISFKLGW